MPVEYHFDHLDPVSFQRLTNAILTARFGESIRLLPLRGPDGGRDSETVKDGPTIEFILERPGVNTPFKAGRYLFQVKHHRTMDKPPSTVRAAVLSDFQEELRSNVLPRAEGDGVNYFFIVTNVTGSRDAVSKVDDKRRELLGGKPNLHADVLWQEHVTAWLDQLPQVWQAFPELFAGNQIPVLSLVAANSPQSLPRAIRMAISAQFRRDAFVRFRQINLEQQLSRLFVDLDAQPTGLTSADLSLIIHAYKSGPLENEGVVFTWHPEKISCLALLLTASERTKRIILEGGPGQGKSTVTQVVAQLYRAMLLQRNEEYRAALPVVSKARLPFRIELRIFAE